MLVYIDPATGSVLGAVLVVVALVVLAAIAIGITMWASRRRPPPGPPAPTSWEDLPPPQPHT